MTTKQQNLDKTLIMLRDTFGLVGSDDKELNCN